MKKRKLLALLLSAVMLSTQVVAAYAADEAPDAVESDAIIGISLPYGLKGMPAGFVPSEKDKALKAK